MSNGRHPRRSAASPRGPSCGHSSTVTKSGPGSRAPLRCRPPRRSVSGPRSAGQPGAKVQAWFKFENSSDYWGPVDDEYADANQVGNHFDCGETSSIPLHASSLIWKQRHRPVSPCVHGFLVGSLVAFFLPRVFPPSLAMLLCTRSSRHGPQIKSPDWARCRYHLAFLLQFAAVAPPDPRMSSGSAAGEWPVGSRAGVLGVVQPVRQSNGSRAM